MWLTESRRIITADTRQQQTLRNNAGLMYMTSSGSLVYGIFMKLIVVGSTGFAVVLPLTRVGIKLSSDTVTHAQVDEHIIALHPPR